jgi:hypothetical protein
MSLRFFDDASEFRARMTPFLIEREAEHNLLFGLVETIVRDATKYVERYLMLLEHGGDTVCVALMTPPHNIVLSLGDDESIRALAAEVFDAGIPVPGVTGAAKEARTFADAWSELTGATAELNFNQRIYKLTEVRAPATVSGAARAVRPADRDLLRSWLQAFNLDALGEAPEPAALDLRLDWYFAGEEDRGLRLWVDGDVPASLAGYTGPTPNGIRIGPVYTPPEHRGRGYASAVTAAVSAEQLARGRRFCFLFTDLANPTSNSIYQKLGYVPVADVDQYRFET